MAWKVRLRKLVNTTGVVVYVCCLWHAVANHVVSFVVCEGNSMQPTINSTPFRDIVLVEYWSRKMRKLKRSDIVVAKQPEKPSVFICKRITAMEGDNIPSDFVIPCQYSTMPRGHLWLVGDNSSSSYDSRHYGPVPYGLVRGRVMFRIWPLSKIGFLR